MGTGEIIGAVIGGITLLITIVSGFFILGRYIGAILEKIERLLPLVNKVSKIENELTSNNSDTKHAIDLSTESLQKIDTLCDRVSYIEGQMS